MARIIGIDYGQKRVGIAVTDPLQMIAAGLKTIPANEALDFLVNYVREEDVECIVVGMPLQMNNKDSEALFYVKQFVTALKRKLPGMKIEYADERFTSKMALQSMVEGGVKKKDRMKKENIDKISAALILQSFLEKKKNII